MERVTALLSGILDLFRKWGSLPEWFRKSISEHPLAWCGSIGVVLLVFLWPRLRALLVPRSRLLRPDRFAIRAEQPRYLKGREADLKELSDLCERQALVFLEGESGAGKSALVRAGLVVECERRKRLHPVYVDLSGAGWEDRLWVFACRELWLSLSQGDRESLGLKSPPPPGELFPLLAAFASRLGRTPLLVFDQFDDYQNTHRHRFREGARANTWITKETLTDKNSFWRELARLLQVETVHCLFVTRTDNASGLDAVRFAKARTYRLARLSGSLIAPLLEEITAPEPDDERPVVSHPERGWERLKRRLLRDLEQEGLILPVQLSVSLQALRRLPELTVGEYERHGGAEGLERLHIERHIAEVSRASGLSADRVRRVLVSLVDPIKGKTTQLKTSELLSVLKPTDEASRKLLSRQLPKSLELLEEHTLVRRRPAPEEDEDAWLLHHDFLWRGVLAAERRADCWHALIREHERRYRLSAGLLHRWRALLSTWQQLRLALKRLSGKFRYAERRRFALISTLRFAPLVLLLSLLWLGSYAIHLRQDDHAAARIFAAIGEEEQIRVMAASSKRVQWKVLELAFAGEEDAKKAREAMPVLLHTYLRLDPTGVLRKRFWKEIARPAVEKGPCPETVLLLAAVWKEAPGERSDAPRLAEAILKEIRNRPEKNGFYDFGSLSGAIEPLVPALEADVAQSLGEELLNAWGERRTVAGSAYLADGLNFLAGRLKEDQFSRAAGYLIDGILPVTIHSSAEYAFRNTFEEFVLHLDSRHAFGLAEKYVSGMAARKEPGLSPYLWGFRCLLDRLDMQGRSSIARQLEKAVMQTSSAFTLALLTSALDLAAEQTDAHLRQPAIERALEVMERQEDTLAIVELSKFLGKQAAALKAEEGRRAVRAILQAMEKEKGAVRLVELGEALGAFSAWLDPEEALWACEKQTREMEYELERGNTAADYSDRRMRSLAQYAERLSETQRLALVDEILALIERNKNHENVHTLAYNMEEIARLLERQQARARGERIMRTIEREEDARVALRLLRMARCFGVKESSDQVRRVGERLLHLMENSKGILSIYWLTFSFVEIHDRIGRDLARRGAELMVEALVGDNRESSPIHMEVARTLALFSDSMDLAQIESALDSVFSTFSTRIGDGWGLLELCAAMEPLWRRVPEEKLKSLAERVAAALSQLASRSKVDALQDDPERTPKIAAFLSHASDQSLVNVLKEPFGVGSRRNVRVIILRAFELKYGLSFHNDLWQFVGWATKDPRTRQLDFH